MPGKITVRLAGKAVEAPGESAPATGAEVDKFGDARYVIICGFSHPRRQSFVSRQKCFDERALEYP